MGHWESGGVVCCFGSWWMNLSMMFRGVEGMVETAGVRDLGC